MNAAASIRPGADEHAPYYGGYIGVVPDGDVIETLRASGAEFAAWVRGRTEAQGRASYEAGKWTVNEVALHVIDAERVFTYRLLRIARGDGTPLPGFEQDDWIAPSRANERTPASLADEFEAVRASTIALLAALPTEGWLRAGTASGKAVTARALAWITAGHAIHHLRILRERYA